LIVIEQFSRECLALVADRALNGHRVALALSQVVADRGVPESITVHNGSQFTSTSFTGVLLKAGIAISMDGTGSWRDNVFVERLRRLVK